jgi:hypothetical protein
MPQLSFAAGTTRVPALRRRVKKRPGPAAEGCVLKVSNGTDTLVQDLQHLGQKTNNEAEICGLCWVYTVPWRPGSLAVIPTPGSCPSLNGPALLPPWNQCAVVKMQLHAEAEAATTAWLRARKHECPILLEDD